MNAYRPRYQVKCVNTVGVHPMVFTHFAWAIYSSKINILYRYCVTTEPMCRPPNEDSTRPILNECVPATVPSEMCEYRRAVAIGIWTGMFRLQADPRSLAMFQ